MYYTQRNDKSENERYLEYELERQREENERMRREEQEQRQRREEERRENAYYHARTADDWPEALSKQSRLMWREYMQFAGEKWSDPEDTDYFAQGSKACDRALELWKVEQKKVDDEIAQLQAKIDQLQESVRVNVGKQLQEEKDVDGWNHVAGVLIDPDCDPTSWLNW